MLTTLFNSTLDLALVIMCMQSKSNLGMTGYGSPIAGLRDVSIRVYQMREGAAHIRYAMQGEADPGKDPQAQDETAEKRIATK